MDNIYSSKNFNDISDVKNSECISIRLFDSDREENLIHGLKVNNELFFGVYAPFWLPNFIHKTSDLIKLENYLDEIIRQVIKKKYKSISIKLAPDFYSKNVNILNYLIEKKKFKQQNNILCGYIPLFEIKNLNDYVNSLIYSSRRNLKRYNKNDFKIESINLDDEKKIKISYDLIDRNRKNIGKKLSYSFSHLKKLILAEKKKIQIFDFYYQKKHIAAAICHQTSKNILYVANWGDHKGDDLKFSVMYNFCYEIIKYCLEKKIEILDLGHSICNENHTDGNFQFKKNLGCTFAAQKLFKLEL